MTSQRRKVSRNCTILSDIVTYHDEYHILLQGFIEEFNEEPIIGVELGPTGRIKPPVMTALDSTQESITWMLSNLDPKIKIDSYQVLNVFRLYQVHILFDCI